MLKRILVIFCAVFFLTACGKKDDVPEVDFKGPTTGPDVNKVMPDYGPNDPVPTEEPTEAPADNPVE